VSESEEQRVYSALALAARTLAVQYPNSDHVRSLEAAGRAVREIRRWQAEGEALFAEPPSMFGLGVWWADRPWRKRP
jgi:hypothetical protein